MWLYYRKSFGKPDTPKYKRTRHRGCSRCGRGFLYHICQTQILPLPTGWIPTICPPRNAATEYAIAYQFREKQHGKEPQRSRTVAPSQYLQFFGKSQYHHEGKEQIRDNQRLQTPFDESHKLGITLRHEQHTRNDEEQWHMKRPYPFAHTVRYRCMSTYHQEYGYSLGDVYPRYSFLTFHILPMSFTASCNTLPAAPRSGRANCWPSRNHRAQRSPRR